MSGLFKNRRLVTGLLVLVLLVITIGVGAVAVLQMPPDTFPALAFLVRRESASQSSSVGQPGSPGPSAPDGEGDPDPQGDGPESPGDGTEVTDGTEATDGTDGTDGTNGTGYEQQPVYFNYPSEMRAVYITPGEDYLLAASPTEASVKQEIDTALEAAGPLGMNTVVLPLYYEGRAVFSGTQLPCVLPGFDILDYAISAAREQGYYVYVIYDSQALPGGDVITYSEALDAALVDALGMQMLQFAELYRPDGIMLDNYYYTAKEDSYIRYLGTGGGMGYQNYYTSGTQSLFSALADKVRDVAPGMQVGMLTTEVWANSIANAAGSATKADFEQLYDGFADTRLFVDEQYVDFVAVRAFGATTDAQIPFAAVANWWGSLLVDYEIPLYVLHASSKAVTDAAGFTEYDQLIKQLIALQDTPGFSGSIYNSLSRLLADPEESTTKLIAYYNGEINPKHVLTELAVTSPAKKTYTTFEQNATFKGASDPNTVITLNGTRISTDANGYFSVNMPLAPGLNKFTFVHKGKTDIYNITRQVVVVKDITPTGNIAVDGGMQITITAIAYQDANVYATVGGQTIPMSKSSKEDESTEKDSSYILFEGVYTAPAATTADQNIGNITVIGEAQGQTDRKEGAFVKVNKKVVLGSGKPVAVVAEQAETFPVNVINDYSHPNHFPLPRGTIDYTVGSEIVFNDGNKSFSYYRLASDLRVYTKDIKAVSDGVNGNAISGMTVTADSRYTKVVLNTAQKVSYNASYEGNAFSITFNYTTKVPASLSLNRNPLFTQATWSGATLRLTFSRANGFLGYRAYYDSSGNLVFVFNNPPEGVLNGAKIVVDPGHGGADPGAIGFLPAYPESVITRQIAGKLAAELRARGASVLLLETNTYPKTTVDVRMQRARDYDPHLFISVHCNSALSSSATGTEIYYFNGYSKALAGYASSAVATAMGTNNRGAKFGYYYVTRDPQFPSILSEIGFLSNEREYKKLLDDSYQQAVATALANSAAQYLRGTGAGNTNATGSQSSGAGATVAGSSSVPSGGAEVTGITLSRHELTLAKGATHTLSYTLSPSGAADPGVYYESDDTSVAKVSQSGVVTAVGTGEALISVTTDDGEYYDDCLVTVTASGSSGSSAGGNAPDEIYFDEDYFEVDVGDSFSITAQFYPSGASKDVIWSIEEFDGSGVVTYTESGATLSIRARKAGSARITATSKHDDSVYADVFIDVYD